MFDLIVSEKKNFLTNRLFWIILDYSFLDISLSEADVKNSFFKCVYWIHFTKKIRIKTLSYFIKSFFLLNKFNRSKFFFLHGSIYVKKCNGLKLNH